MVKNSSRIIFLSWKSVVASGLLLMIFASNGYAQMFSVQSERERITTPRSAASFGVSFVDFQYRGPAESAGTAADYSFSAPLAHLRLDLQGLTLYGIYGRNLGEQSNVYSEFGAEISGGVVLVPGDAFNVVFPIALATDYVLARNQRIQSTAEEFRQNNLGIKGGLQINARLSPQARFTAEAMTGYSFSITGYGLSSGNAVDWQLNNRIYFDRLFNQFGIVAGFDLKSRRYNLEENDFNYRTIYQNLVIGITF